MAVMEWIDGVKFSDTQALAQFGFGVPDVMTTLTKALAYQVFVCGRVHGDPHPGNVFVRPVPGKPKQHQVRQQQKREKEERSKCLIWTTLCRL